MYVCSYVCVFICMHMQTRVDAVAHASVWGSKINVKMSFLNHFYTCAFETRYLIELEALAGICSPVQTLQAHATMPSCLLWFGESGLKSSFLSGQHFMH